MCLYWYSLKANEHSGGELFGQFELVLILVQAKLQQPDPPPRLTVLDTAAFSVKGIEGVTIRGLGLEPCK